METSKSNDALSSYGRDATLISPSGCSVFFVATGKSSSYSRAAHWLSLLIDDKHHRPSPMLKAGRPPPANSIGTDRLYFDIRDVQRRVALRICGVEGAPRDGQSNR